MEEGAAPAYVEGKLIVFFVKENFDRKSKIPMSENF